MRRCAMRSGAPDEARSMPISAGASSSSVSPDRGQGRSGGFRVIVVFRRGERAFFVHGFAKSNRENLRRNELRALRELANEMFGLDEPGLGAMLANGTISEVNCDG